MEKKMVEWEVLEPGRRVNWKVCLNYDQLLTAEQASGFQTSTETQLHLIGLLDEIKQSRQSKKDEPANEEWIDISTDKISIRERKNFNDNFIICGIIENIKNKHFEKMRNLYAKTIKLGKDEPKDI